MNNDCQWVGVKGTAYRAVAIHISGVAATAALALAQFVLPMMVFFTWCSIAIEGQRHLLNPQDTFAHRPA